MTHPLLEEAQKLQSQTIAVRREIHRHPELGLDLPRTRETVLDALEVLGDSSVFGGKVARSIVTPVVRDEAIRT